MINPPPIEVYAISMDEWESLKRSGLEEIPEPEEGAFEIEVWTYSPHLFANKGIVDPFSLYMSLEEINDERVESALEEMMENIQW